MSLLKPSHSSPSDVPVPSPAAAGEVPIEVLHERVNELLEVPLPKESDSWPLPVPDRVAAGPA